MSQEGTREMLVASRLDDQQEGTPHGGRCDDQQAMTAWCCGDQQEGT
jgi:hypothetical protein